VIASADGRTAFVPIYGNSGVGKPGTDGQTLVAIDIASQKIVNKLDFGRGVRPHCPLIGPKDGLLYVTTELDKTISLIDPKTLKIVGTIRRDNRKATCWCSRTMASAVIRRMWGRELFGARYCGAQEHQGDSDIGEHAADCHFCRRPVGLYADQTKPQLAVIDTKSDAVTKGIPLEGVAYGTRRRPMGAGCW